MNKNFSFWLKNPRDEYGFIKAFIVAVIIHVIILIMLPDWNLIIIKNKERDEKITLISANFVKIIESKEAVVKIENEKTRTKVEVKEAGDKEIIAIPPKIVVERNDKIIVNNKIPEIPMPKDIVKREREQVITIAEGRFDKGLMNEDKFIASSKDDRIMDIEIKSTIKESEDRLRKEPIKINDDIEIADKITMDIGENEKGGIGKISMPDGLSAPEVVEGKGEARMIGGKMPSYPAAAKSNNWEGIVSLTLTVDENSNVKDVFVKEKSGYDVLDQAAKKSAYEWKISITDKGMKIAGKVNISVKFKLKGRW